LAENPPPFLETWTASDGYTAHCRRYLPREPAHAHLICLHGIQSHGGWYEYSSARLCQAGYAVHYLDRRGSGLNQEARGDAPSFRRLIDDVAEFIAPLRREMPEVPVVAVAGSWGGKLATALCRRHPGLLDALVLLCPGLFPKVRPPFGQRLRIFLARLANPTRRFPIPLNDPELFTANPRWQAFIAGDPLALREATARLLVESVRLDLYLRWVPAWVTVPTLLMLAEHDRIIDNARTRAYVGRFATPEKQIIEYAGAHHTLEFEPDRDRFIDDLITWLRGREKLILRQRQLAHARAAPAPLPAPQTDEALNPGLAENG
jgi:alpha-beta hydrolase superfamily lysophospholipase